ncbi:MULTISPECIES: N-acetyltransferase [unclassified Pseudonocardia]|uniref:GNAT family N-acetyltransferase n=1 Tax=unclassified Pseudonocardia TaxID=2619320 RepID=UPI00094AB54D|nr:MULTISPECIES: GNAT family N-acetyltransferase [unclassified Pseudonocardia]
MSAITVRPFRRSDRDQLTDLIHSHAHAAIPGTPVTVNAVLSQLEHEPDEFIVDTWVRERATVVGEQRGRITAAAHVVRYGGTTDVAADLRDSGELRWLLQWPDASYWPDAHLAGRAVADAAVAVLRSWNVRSVLADFALPAPGLTGVPEQWPHVVRLLDELGFESRRSEQVLLADVATLPDSTRDDLTIRRTLGERGTRFTALTAEQELGYVEIDTTIAGPGRVAAPVGWADVGNLRVAEDSRWQGVGTTLVAAAAHWLRLARVDRLLAYAEPDESELVAFLRRCGFQVVTTCHRGWVQTGDVRRRTRDQ